MSSFDGASLADMRAMIADADPDGLDAVASKWSAINDALRQAQDDFLRHTLAATTHWQGAAANAFSARADELHRSLGNGAAYAFNASSGVSFAADALRAARTAMPPETVTLDGIAAAAQARAAGSTPAQIDDHQRRQGAAVMRQLEKEYAAAGVMIGKPEGQSSDCDHGIFEPVPASEAAISENAHTSPYVRRIGNVNSPFSTKEKSVPTRATEPDNTNAQFNPSSPRYCQTDSMPTGSRYDVNPARQMLGNDSLQGSRLGQRDRFTGSIFQTTSEPSSPSPDSSNPESESNRPTDAPGIIRANPFSPSTRRQSSPLKAYESITTGRHHPSYGHSEASPPEVMGGSILRQPYRSSLNKSGLTAFNFEGDATSGGPMAPPVTVPANLPSRENLAQRGKRKRPAYLNEDESTWVSSGEVNPPVIER